VIGLPFLESREVEMAPKASNKLIDGAACNVVGGTHAGKSGTVTDINTSKSGNVTITVVQKNGVRFKTLARNVEVVGKK
jgi:ribosomal protein S4E